MTSRRDRIFAWVGVVIAALSAVALSAAVVVQQIITDRNNKAQAALQNAVAACQRDTKAEPTLPVPDAYQPAGTVNKLQATDMTAGSGQAVQSGDCLVVKYYGTLAATGAKFDENFTLPSGFEFMVGKGQVIPGWDQGLLGMKVGGTRRLVIPAELAYGSQGNASIPPNSALVFVVKLLRIQK